MKTRSTWMQLQTKDTFPYVLWPSRVHVSRLHDRSTPPEHLLFPRRLFVCRRLFVSSRLFSSRVSLFTRVSLLSLKSFLPAFVCFQGLFVFRFCLFPWSASLTRLIFMQLWSWISPEGEDDFLSCSCSLSLGNFWQGKDSFQEAYCSHARTPFLGMHSVIVTILDQNGILCKRVCCSHALVILRCTWTESMMMGKWNTFTQCLDLWWLRAWESDTHRAFPMILGKGKTFQYMILCMSGDLSFARSSKSC